MCQLCQFRREEKQKTNFAFYKLLACDILQQINSAVAIAYWSFFCDVAAKLVSNAVLFGFPELGMCEQSPLDVLKET